MYIKIDRNRKIRDRESSLKAFGRRTIPRSGNRQRRPACGRAGISASDGAVGRFPASGKAARLYFFFGHPAQSPPEHPPQPPCLFPERNAKTTAMAISASRRMLTAFMPHLRRAYRAVAPDTRRPTRSRTDRRARTAPTDGQAPAGSRRSRPRTAYTEDRRPAEKRPRPA